MMITTIRTEAFWMNAYERLRAQRDGCLERGETETAEALTIIIDAIRHTVECQFEAEIAKEKRWSN